jgi:hypothetical protein
MGGQGAARLAGIPLAVAGRVLVVEYDADILETLAEILELVGFSVTRAPCCPGSAR